MKTAQDITGLDCIIHFDIFTRQIAVLVRDKDGNQVNDTYYFKSKMKAFTFITNNQLKRAGCA